MLLHVVKPPLPVHPDLDLAPRGQRCLCEMIGLGPTTGYSQHRDVVDGTTVIRLGEKSNQHQGRSHPTKIHRHSKGKLSERRTQILSFLEEEETVSSEADPLCSMTGFPVLFLNTYICCSLGQNSRATTKRSKHSSEGFSKTQRALILLVTLDYLK